MLRTCTWPYHLSSVYLMLVLSLAPLLGLVLMYLVLLGHTQTIPKHKLCSRE